MKVISEIKIRGIDPVAIKKIDVEARKRKMSRNQLLKIMIESFAVLPELHSLDEKYASLIKNLEIVLNKNTEVLNKVAETVV